MIDSGDGLEARFTLEKERGGVVDEPPFRMLVLGDWCGDAEAKPIAERSPVEIDRDNFDDVLRRFGPRLSLSQKEGETLELRFETLDDFHPDQIVERLPLFGRLRELRQRLLSTDGFNEAAREVRSWLSVDEPVGESVSEKVARESGADSPDGLLDAILSGSSVPASKIAAPETGDVASLVKDLVRSHLVSVDESEQVALLAAVDAAISDLMRRILHEPKFEALEAAWRGLYLLVRRTETGSDLKLFVQQLRKDEFAEDLRSVGDLRDSVVYKTLISDVDDDDPWSLVIGNYGFMTNKDDVAALMRVSKIAAAANAPFISHVRPDILGSPSLAGNTDPTRWRISTDTESGKLWALLRSVPESQYLGMVIPRFLSRLPYGRETEPLEKFQFEEFTETPPDHDRYLWSNGCFIAGLLIAKTFSEFGWDMDHRFIQDIEQLPMHMFESGGETVYQPCAEVLLTQNACERLMELGFMPIVSYKNTDHVKLARFQSISDPVTGLRSRWSG